MIIRLFCAACAFNGTPQLPTGSVEVPVPVSRLADDGQYSIRCAAGHETTVTLDNIKFELLFEMALNALVDGYPREAVSSFAASLERFHEFYWFVAATYFGIAPDTGTAAWKPLSRMSERQLGAFVSMALLITRKSPSLLSNREVQFRNDVIHNGYVPADAEAIAFGDSVLGIIRAGLADLRATCPDAMISTYRAMSPAALEIPDRGEDAYHGTCNILTAVDVRNPPSESDSRRGDVVSQFERIQRDRTPHGMVLITPDELQRQDPAAFERLR